MSNNNTETTVFGALRGEHQEPTLHWYEQVKKDMDFDPEALGPQIEDPQPWNLQEDYPPGIREMINDLTVKLKLSPEQLLGLEWLARSGWTPEQLEQVAESLTEERSELDEQIQEAPQATEHTDPGPSRTTTGGNTKRSGKVGKGRADRGGQGGSSEPLPGGNDTKVAVGQQP